jgi:hypothetical protein
VAWVGLRGCCLTCMEMLAVDRDIDGSSRVTEGKQKSH